MSSVTFFRYYFSYIDANEALKLKEDFAEALLIKALALCGLKYYTEARECLDACLELDPTKMNAKLTKFSITKLVRVLIIYIGVKSV